MFNNVKSQIKAVYDDDLIKYLKSIGLYEKIMAKQIRCIYCGNYITIANLEIIVPGTNKVKIVCNNKNCINQL